MPRLIPCVMLLAVLSLTAARAAADEPAAKPKAKIELRWLEGKAIKGLTQDKGIQTTCGDQLSYPHLKAVLTNKDIAGARMTENDFSKNGLPGTHIMIDFQLTEAARKTLIAEVGAASGKELAVFVDGRYWGTSNFQKASAATFAPHCGFINSKELAERIVEAVK